jgi:hypothetical protein
VSDCFRKAFSKSSGGVKEIFKIVSIFKEEWFGYSGTVVPPPAIVPEFVSGQFKEIRRDGVLLWPETRKKRRRNISE